MTQVPQFAFHSVDPQPVKAKKTYAQKMEEEAQQGRLMETEEMSTHRPAPVEAKESQSDQVQEEEEQMSAYDRVMAKRAGHSPTKEVEEEPTPDATGFSTVTEAVEAEETTAAPSSCPRRSKEEIESTNNFMENIWLERLKQMGHRSVGSSSPYSKGKKRQIGENAPE